MDTNKNPNYIDISGLDKADVLFTLVLFSIPEMKNTKFFLDAYIDSDITIEDAKWVIKEFEKLAKKWRTPLDQMLVKQVGDVRVELNIFSNTLKAERYDALYGQGRAKFAIENLKARDQAKKCN